MHRLPYSPVMPNGSPGVSSSPGPHASVLPSAPAGVHEAMRRSEEDGIPGPSSHRLPTGPGMSYGLGMAQAPSSSAPSGVVTEPASGQGRAGHERAEEGGAGEGGGQGGNQAWGSEAGPRGAGGWGDGRRSRGAPREGPPSPWHAPSAPSQFCIQLQVRVRRTAHHLYLSSSLPLSAAPSCDAWIKSSSHEASVPAFNKRDWSYVRRPSPCCVQTVVKSWPCCAVHRPVTVLCSHIVSNTFVARASRCGLQHLSVTPHHPCSTVEGKSKETGAMRSPKCAAATPHLLQGLPSTRCLVCPCRGWPHWPCCALAPDCTRVTLMMVVLGRRRGGEGSSMTKTTLA